LNNASNTQEGHGTLTSYVVGFCLCIVLTLTSYFLVTEELLSGKTLIYAIAGLCLAQALIQLILFLHLDAKSNSSLNLFIFLFMALVVLIIVLGSLWIMYNLNYRMMPLMTEKKSEKLGSDL